MRPSSFIPHNSPERSYAFGSAVKERTASFTQKYRFGFNNQEQETELGEYYSFEYRVHDARLGRFMSVDPLANSLFYISSYCISANNPALFRDLLGLISEGTAANPPGGSGTRAVIKDLQARVEQLNKVGLSGQHVIKWNQDSEKFEIWKASSIAYSPINGGGSMVRGDGSYVLPSDPDYADIRIAEGNFEKYFTKVEEYKIGAFNRLRNWLSKADESAHKGAIRNFAEDYFGPELLSLHPIVGAYETFTGNDLYGGKLSSGEQFIGFFLTLVPGGKVAKKLTGKKLAKALSKYDKPIMNTAKAGSEITQRGLHFNVGDVHVETLIEGGHLSFTTKGGNEKQAKEALKSVTTWLNDSEFREKTLHVLNDFINDEKLIDRKSAFEDIKKLIIESYGN